MKPELKKRINHENISEYLSVSKDTISTWNKKGIIPYTRAGKQFKFKIYEVEEWLREGKLKMAITTA
jgi:excisionase family DNA binding protein